MAKKELVVPKGKDLIGVSVSGHKYVRILDAAGNEAFRSDSPGEGVSVLLQPGTYTLDTDGQIGAINLGVAEARHRATFDASKPPKG